MNNYTKTEMFTIAKDYIYKFHSSNPIVFVTNVYVFYYMSGRFPDASMSDCCAVVEALRKHYISELSSFDALDDALPFC